MNESVHDWLAYLHNLRQLSKNSLRSYRHDLKVWFEYLAEKGEQDLVLGSVQARSFLAHLCLLGLSPATVNRRLSALKSYYNWLRRQDPLLVNPFAHSSTVKKGRHLPCYLSYEEVEKFIDNTTEDFSGLRDRVLFELLYSTGCRVSELCALNKEDLANRQICVRGKGDRDRWIFVGDKAAKALDDYLVLRQEHLADHSDSRAALILDLRGFRLSTRGVYYLVRRAALRVGLPKKVSPHSFRHSFATHILDGGADVRTVQELLGHANLSTTQIYTHTSIEKIREVYRSSHPHARRQSFSGGKDKNA